jgi:hypothetical protein
VAQQTRGYEYSFGPIGVYFGPELVGARPFEVGAYPNLSLFCVPLLLPHIPIVPAHLNIMSYADRLCPLASGLVEN